MRTKYYFLFPGQIDHRMWDGKTKSKLYLWFNLIYNKTLLLVDRVFPKGPEDLGLIPGRIISTK